MFFSARARKWKSSGYPGRLVEVISPTISSRNPTYRSANASDSTHPGKEELSERKPCKLFTHWIAQFSGFGVSKVLDAELESGASFATLRVRAWRLVLGRRCFQWSQSQDLPLLTVTENMSILLGLILDGVSFSAFLLQTLLGIHKRGGVNHPDRKTKPPWRRSSAFGMSLPYMWS